MLKCVGCDYEVDNEIKTCPVCKQPPAGHPCNVCKRRIPDDAEVCNTCKSYQTRWWRFLFKAGAILLSLGTAITIGVNIGNLASALNRNSHTHMKVLTAKTDAGAVRVSVWNTGEKPSWLLASRLVFEDAPIAPVPLSLRQPADEDCTLNLITDKPVIACLKAGAVVFRHPGTDGAPYLTDEALAIVRKHKVTLQLDVEESNDPGMLRSHHTLEQTFNESLVDPFLAVKQ